MAYPGKNKKQGTRSKTDGRYSIWHLIKLGVTTAATFTLMFLPWLQPFPSALLQVLHRIFPFSRGIFEDKVANFWCASNVVVKWRNWFSIAAMARVSYFAKPYSQFQLIVIARHRSHACRAPAHHLPPIPRQIYPARTEGGCQEQRQYPCP